jgi:hypothetical protein
MEFMPTNGAEGVSSVAWDTLRDILIVCVLLPLLVFQVTGPQNATIITILIGGLLTPAAFRIDIARRDQKKDDG